MASPVARGDGPALVTVPELAPFAVDAAGTFALLDDDGRAVVDDVLAAGKIDRDRLIAVYRTMRLVRALDERMMMHQRQGRIGFYGACTGQEAVPVAVAEALQEQDWVFPALREGPVMLHRGYDLVTYLCQVFGNSGDVLKGRNMPSHMADKAVNQVSWSSVIGPQITQAVGVAYAARLKGDDVVVVAFMGDGATSSADFHTGLNFASVWKVPVVFVCQNNHWSISVPTAKQTASDTIAQKALAYGIPGYRVDGNDPIAVHRAAYDAVEAARAGNGPSFIEYVTYRIGAHSSSDDPRVYRDEAEVDVWRARDPLDRLSTFLRESKYLSKKEDENIAREAKAYVAQCVARAEDLPRPSTETLFTDVFAEPTWVLREQAREFAAGQDEDE